MSNNVNFVFFNMWIEWQIISDFNQKQMNDLKNFFERTIIEIINVCFDLVFAFVFAFFAFSQSASWNSIIDKQKQSAIESIFALKRFVFSINLNDFANIVASVSSVSSSTAISLSNALATKFSFSNSRFAIISSFRWFRFVLKRALIALLTAYDAFVLSRRFVVQIVIFYWRVAFLYRCLMKKKFD